MQWLLLFLVALSPGLVSWWSGRRLLARRDAPALAERYLAHNFRAYVLAFIVLIGVSIVLVFNEHPFLAGLIALVPLLSLVAGGFPLRKALYEESWGFFTYFSFMLRLLVGVPGFWILLVLTPFVIKGAGDLEWVAAVLSGLVLVLWNRRFGAVLARLTDARPLEDPEGRFSAYFARIDERASVEPPECLVVPVPGGRLVNALALPSKRRPRVLFTSSLLELLEPEEVGAIYAHEIGHLEYFQQPSRRRVLEVFVHAMIAAALAWGLFDWSDGFWAGMLWPVFFLVLMRLKNQWTRGHEKDTDLRAVELFGDAEALIRGLERLHRLMLMPRRLAAEKESAMTHPSLARRLQAIRRAAGLDARREAALPPGEEEPSTRNEEDEPLLLYTTKPGEALLLEAERLSFFEGVFSADVADAPESATPSFDDLARVAAASRAQPYQRLQELRIEPRRGRHFLLAVDERGKKRRFSLREEDVARLERRLDAIDVHLASVEDGGSGVMGSRPLAAIAAVAAILPPVTGAVAVPALFAALRPRPASLVTAGITGLAACAYRFLRVPAHWLDPFLTTTSSGLLGIVSLFLLASGIRWARQLGAEEKRDQTAWPLAVTCWTLALLEWGALYFMSRAGDSFDVFRASQLLFWSPSAFLLPLAAAVALFFVPRRRPRRWLALPAAALVLVPLGASTTALRNALVEDPLIPDAPAPPAVRRSLEEVARREIDAWGPNLRLSPSGETFALCVAPPGWDFCSQTWTLGRFDDAALPSAFEAEISGVTDLVFLDDERLVLLRLEGGEISGGELSDGEIVLEERGAGATRTIQLPAFDYSPELAAAGESWLLFSSYFDEDRHLLRRRSSRFASVEINETVWELGMGDSARASGMTGEGNLALGLQWTILPGYLRICGPSWLERLTVVSPAAPERFLLSTRLALECRMPPLSRDALCLAHERGRSQLFRIGLEEGELEAIGGFPSPGDEEILATARGLVLRTPHGAVYHYSPDRELAALEWPDGSAPSAATAPLAAAPGLVATLQHAPDGRDGSVVVLYRRATPGSG